MLALPLPFYIYIIKSVLVVLFCFVLFCFVLFCFVLFCYFFTFLVFPGDTTGTLYLQVAINYEYLIR